MTALSARIAKVIALIALFAAPVGAVDSALAAKTIYKCTKDGQITLTDKPCDDAKASDSSSSTAPQSGATTISSSSNPSPVGDWHGQIQYQGRESGQTLEEAHSVVPSLVTFTADGKVSGASQESGCKWLGVWSQGGRIISIDMSLTGCGYSGLDRRYTGTFLLGVPDSSGEVLLQVYTLPLPGRGTSCMTSRGR